MPGHTLELSLDHFTPEVRQYWQLPTEVRREQKSDGGMDPGMPSICWSNRSAFA